MLTATRTPPALGLPLTESMRIAGERVGAARTLEVFNPYTNDVVGTVPRAAVCFDC